MELKVKQNTVFKQTAEESAKLKDADKISVAANRSFKIHSWKTIDKKHIRVAILGEKLGTPERNTWCVFTEHVQLIDSQGKVVTLQPSQPPALFQLPEIKNLDIPYKSQLDNELNPTGSCNVTSFAMVMSYFQMKGKSGVGQLEDELYEYMENKGLSRHDPEDLVKMATAYGLKDDFTTRGSLVDVRKAITEGRPCIVHGYFTSFGHIIVVRGFDPFGFFVNDPYGEWTSSGYRCDLTGENLHYSNGMMQTRCSPEGETYIWLHRLSKA